MIQDFLSTLSNGVLYSLFAIGFALVYNTTKILHIVAAALYVLAAYLYWWLCSAFSLPQLWAGLISPILIMGASLLTDLFLYRPLSRRKASKSVIMVASIGLTMIIVSLLALSGYAYKSVSSSISKTTYLWQIVLGIAALSTFALFISLTEAGKRLRAYSDNPDLYETLGYDKNRCRIEVFALSGFFIAFASCLSVYANGGLDVSMGVSYCGMNALVNAMVAMILGGAERFGSCIAGGFSLALLQKGLILLLHTDDLKWMNAFTFLLLILLLLLRPQGIAGYKRRAI